MSGASLRRRDRTARPLRVEHYWAAVNIYKDGGFTAGFQSLFPIIETLTDAERQRVMFASIMPNLFIGTVPDGCLYYIADSGSFDRRF